MHPDQNPPNPLSAPVPPRRRVCMELRLQADSREALTRALWEIHVQLQRGYMWGDSCSGGSSDGYFCSITEDENITHESYHQAVQEFLSKQ